jgi:osmoprotectant transport system ATP-binding protein
MTVLLVTHDIDEAIKLGDRVAILKQGGVLAQYAPPAELLAHPADEFVAQFVGTDRDLKRLALLTVAAVRPADLPIASPADTLGRAPPQQDGSEHDGLLLLNADGRPVGWWSRNDGQSPAPESARPMPLVTKDVTLRDALSMLLAADPPVGCIVDEDGRYVGGLTLVAISEALRESGGVVPIGPAEALA